MTTNAVKQMRMEFCRDLCNELIIPGDYPPVYPPWAKELAVHMTKLGWTKPGAEKETNKRSGGIEDDIQRAI